MHEFPDASKPGVDETSVYARGMTQKQGNSFCQQLTFIWPGLSAVKEHFGGPLEGLELRA